ncbi:hypothetical protein BpHYR1_018244 [Brachionus plicatilis]|uniref:Uncharacterized protein n=1 Tax=Brachionus plicatilis TaxID=10195 RepID=A0A3M7QWC0_BRAPC|nr:hypothetical protein BpHYR1_018244 [Brachionus plicatilis]
MKIEFTKLQLIFTIGDFDFYLNLLFLIYFHNWIDCCVLVKVTTVWVSHERQMKLRNCSSGLLHIRKIN